MKKQKLKQWFRKYGCTIESHSKDESFQEAGNFILGKWGGTTFVVESIENGGIVLRVAQRAGWSSHFSPCRACSQFMGVDAPTETTFNPVSEERSFIWRVEPALKPE